MRIALCIPVHSGGKPAFIESLGRMIDWTHRANLRDGDGAAIKPVFGTLVFSSSNVAYSRNTLATKALKESADWLLWLDSDHSFPANTLTRLLSHGKLIVGANYRRRLADEVMVTAYRLRDGRLDPVLETGNGLEPVHSMGLGVCLTHASVFQRIEPPYFSWGLHADGGMIGEDVSFFDKVRAAGIPAFVDLWLSGEVGHVADVELRLPKAEAVAAAAPDAGRAAGDE